MIYIISGTEDEAKKYAGKNGFPSKEWKFIPDSEYSLVYKEIPVIIFIGTYKNRKDIVDRLMECRDILVAKIADLTYKLIYDNEDNLITQADYNKLVLNLEITSNR